MSYTELLSGPAHPFHKQFNPAPGLGLGSEDLKVIEAHTFLTSVASGTPAEPDFKSACDVAKVQKAIIRSWESERWETVSYKLPVAAP